MDISRTSLNISLTMRAIASAAVAAVANAKAHYAKWHCVHIAVVRGKALSLVHNPIMPNTAASCAAAYQAARAKLIVFAAANVRVHALNAICDYQQRVRFLAW